MFSVDSEVNIILIFLWKLNKHYLQANSDWRLLLIRSCHPKYANIYGICKSEYVGAWSMRTQKFEEKIRSEFEKKAKKS